MLQLGRRGKGNRIPNVVAAGTGATPAAFYLGLCRLRGILSPPAPHDFAAGGLIIVVATMVLQRFASSGLKSRITARWRAFPVETLQRLPTLPFQIKNRCTQERVNGEILR